MTEYDRARRCGSSIVHGRQLRYCPIRPKLIGEQRVGVEWVKSDSEVERRHNTSARSRGDVISGSSYALVSIREESYAECFSRFRFSYIFRRSGRVDDLYGVAHMVVTAARSSTTCTSGRGWPYSGACSRRLSMEAVRKAKRRDQSKSGPPQRIAQ